jgi:hypothetical protein
MKLSALRRKFLMKLSAFSAVAELTVVGLTRTCIRMRLVKLAPQEKAQNEI